jgi:NAD(P)-dependent dehydrogenase (short-subunit alcohol dehydrogenase family)
MSDMTKQYFEGPNAIRLEPVIAKLALDRPGQPEDGAAAMLFLCSEQANYITGSCCPWTVDSSSTTRARRERA